MTLTVTDLRLHIDSTLGDAALQLRLDAAYEAISQRVQPSGTVAESFTVTGDTILLSRVATGVVSIVEWWNPWYSVPLANSDWELRPSGQTLRRLTTGTNPWPRWRGRVDVVYLGSSDDQLRDSVAIQLVQLDVNTHPGLSEQSLGAWSEKYDARAAGTYKQQRDDLLSVLDSVGVML